MEEKSSLISAPADQVWALALAYVARGNFTLKAAIEKAIRDIDDMRNWTKKESLGQTHEGFGPRNAHGGQAVRIVQWEKLTILEIRGEDFVMGTEIRNDQPETESDEG